MIQESRILVRHPSRADLLLVMVRRSALTRRAGTARAIETVRAGGRAS